MDSVLEHIIHEVRIWLDEVIQGRQNLQVLSLLFMEEVESDFVLVEFHLVDCLLKFVPLVFDHLFSFFDLFLFLLQLFDFFVDLFFHHLEQVLMLDFELVHNSSEALLQLVDLFIELLSHFHFQLVVELFVH